MNARFVNQDRTVLVEMHTGRVTVALRTDAGDIWGPPEELLCEERSGCTWPAGDCKMANVNARPGA